MNIIQAQEEPLLKFGDIRFHKSFGEGVVIDVDAKGICKVHFKKAGPKRVKADFLTNIAAPSQENYEPRGDFEIFWPRSEYDPPAEVIRDTIPETGVGFLGGQSGAYKTFCAIELAICMTMGLPFAGRKIERTGAVLYIAFEGAGTIQGRVQARRARLDDPGAEIPLVMLSGFGPIARPQDYEDLKKRIKDACDDIKSEFGVELNAIIIDTVTAAGMIPEDKENDPAAWQRVFDGLNPISKNFNVPIILVHHYGKSADAGLRGSSNARAAADFVLAMTCQRDEITGDTSGHFLALTKSRAAPEGGIAAVTAEQVEIGHRADGDPVTSLVLSFDVETKLRTVKARRPSKADQVFQQAFSNAMASEAEDVRVHGEAAGPKVKAVRLAHVRDEFAKLYVTGSGDDKKRNDTIRKQFSNALDRLPPSIVTGSWHGVEWAWPLTVGGMNHAE